MNRLIFKTHQIKDYVICIPVKLMRKNNILGCFINDYRRIFFETLYKFDSFINKIHILGRHLLGKFLIFKENLGFKASKTPIQRKYSIDSCYLTLLSILQFSVSILPFWLHYQFLAQLSQLVDDILFEVLPNMCESVYRFPVSKNSEYTV